MKILPALKERWTIVAFVVLFFMMLGAVLAALTSPTDLLAPRRPGLRTIAALSGTLGLIVGVSLVTVQQHLRPNDRQGDKADLTALSGPARAHASAHVTHALAVGVADQAPLVPSWSLPAPAPALAPASAPAVETAIPQRAPRVREEALRPVETARLKPNAEEIVPRIVQLPPRHLPSDAASPSKPADS